MDYVKLDCREKIIIDYIAEDEASVFAMGSSPTSPEGGHLT